MESRTPTCSNADINSSGRNLHVQQCASALIHHKDVSDRLTSNDAETMAVLKWEDMDQEAREYFEQAALDSLNLKQVVPQTPTAQGRVQPVPSTSSTTTFEASLRDQGISPWRAFLEERLPVLKQYFPQMSQPVPDTQGLIGILKEEWESMDAKQKAPYELRAERWQYGQEGILNNQWRRERTLQKGN